MIKRAAQFCALLLIYLMFLLITLFDFAFSTQAMLVPTYLHSIFAPISRPQDCVVNVHWCLLKLLQRN